jgi:hypothetical protein
MNNVVFIILLSSSWSRTRQFEYQKRINGYHRLAWKLFAFSKMSFVLFVKHTWHSDCTLHAVLYKIEWSTKITINREIDFLFLFYHMSHTKNNICLHIIKSEEKRRRRTIGKKETVTVVTPLVYAVAARRAKSRGRVL